MEKIIVSYVFRKCPATKRQEKIWYRYIPNTILFECLGCDNACGSSTCQQCMDSITKESVKD